jgi:8-oxo-dGTP diphosphatase
VASYYFIFASFKIWAKRSHSNANLFQNAKLESTMEAIDVTAAIIEKDGKFLIAKRAKGKHMEGRWEFPGGKIEKRETPEVCLARELKEEFDIVAKIGDFVAESVFDYGIKKIKLLGYRVKYVSGEFKLYAHDEIKWIDKNEFGKFDFAPADLSLIEKISNSNA